jgi:hypothetical protein
MKRKLFKLIIKARGHKCAYMKARARRVMRECAESGVWAGVIRRVA